MQDDTESTNNPLMTEHMVGGYQTVKDTRSFNHHNSSQHRTIAQYQKDKRTALHTEDQYAPRMCMPRTRNRYRPRAQKPTECDDMLFGKPVSQDFKEWKAPWDNSKSVQPLVYDSTDRAGHYSPEKPKSHQHVQSANTRRAWR